MSLVVSLLAGLVIHPPPAEGQASVVPLNPATVFREVCLEGGHSFARGAVMPVGLRDLPRSLRSGFDHFDFRAGRAQRFGSVASGVRFFRLADSDAYLMTAGPGMRNSAPCAVFWQGRHWAEIREGLADWVAIPDPAVPPNAYLGQVWIEVQLDGHAVAVANHQGWIMMRAEALDRLKPTESVN